MSFAKKFLSSRSGASAIEYGIITAVIGMSSVAAVSVTGGSLAQTLDCVSSNLAGDLCIGGQENSQVLSSEGWGGDFSVQAGKTYEIEFPEDMQFTVWNDGRIWYDPDEGYEQIHLLANLIQNISLQIRLDIKKMRKVNRILIILHFLKMASYKLLQRVMAI